MNVKNLVGFILLTVVGYVSIAVCIINLSHNYNFYKNSKHTTGYLLNIVNEENSNKANVRFGYKSDGKEYTYTLVCSQAEAQSFEGTKNISLFYDKTNPKDCRTSTRSVSSIYLIIGLLFIIGSYGLFICLRDMLKIRHNLKLIKGNEFIFADFSKINKRKSYYNTNRGIENYVICTYEDNNNETYTFKSIVMYNDVGHYLKDKKLKVYINKNNLKEYLVDINYINEVVEEAKKETN